MRKFVHLVSLSYACVITMHGSKNVKFTPNYFICRSKSINISGQFTRKHSYTWAPVCRVICAYLYEGERCGTEVAANSEGHIELSAYQLNGTRHVIIRVMRTNKMHTVSH